MNTIFAGEERVLGCLQREAPVGSVVPMFSSAVPMIPRDKWKPVDWSYLIKVVLDQNGLGACVGFSAAATMMGLRAAAGLEHVLLSGGHLYGQINGGSDRGAYLSDSIVALKNTGICPASVVPELSWQQRTWPSNWKDIARENRALEAFDSNTFDALAVAAQRGFLSSFGVMIDDGFDTDNEGYIAPRRRAKGGHAITCVGVHYGRNKWWLKILNSWTPKWGVGGYGYLPEAYLQGDFIDGWSLRAITFPGDTNIPQLI